MRMWMVYLLCAPLASFFFLIYLGLFLFGTLSGIAA